MHTARGIPTNSSVRQSCDADSSRMRAMAVICAPAEEKWLRPAKVSVTSAARLAASRPEALSEVASELTVPAATLVWVPSQWS